MARPTTYRGTLVAIYFEDSANPGTFLKPCGLNNHSYQFTKNANEVTVPDCDDPELPAWVERETESLDFSASGEGVLAAEAIDAWWALFANTDSTLARMYVGSTTDIINGKYWEGKLHLNEFSITGNRGERTQVSISVVSDGELTYNNVV